MHLSIREYRTRLRMQKAVIAIRDGTKIEAVALTLGYRSLKTFYRQFEHFFGMTPSMLREQPAHPASS
jgi:AraC-like DNA-binding protein